MLAIIAPGQGSQTPGMLTSWLEGSAQAELLSSWSESIGLDLLHLGTTADAEEIKDTANAQPLIVAAGLLSANALNLSGKFSYVHVDFNAQGGFLHVIESEKLFSKTFLKEILSPFLKKDISEIKYPKKLSQKELIDYVEDYKNQFNYFDWTKYNN